MSEVTNPNFSPALTEALIHFFTNHPARRVSKSLLILLCERLRKEDGMNELVVDSLMDLEGLFELLEVAGDEWKRTVE